MAKILRNLQTAAADRTRFVQHPRLYRTPTRAAEPQGDWIDAAFKWGLFGWLMWMIWAPVLLVLAIILIVLV